MSKSICWWSGGVTSAAACKLWADIVGADNCDFVFIGTLNNEDDDTQRFKDDCEKWYGKEIKTIQRKDYLEISDVWRKHNSLNTANGAICSSELKRTMREQYQKENPAIFQVFGFDIDEPKRAKAMRLNYPEINPIFPLLLYGFSKKKCIDILASVGIKIPDAYLLGFSNNNCLKTGCVQGGIGYWQKFKETFPDRFEKMANLEHELSAKKGKPVTICKDQSKDGKLVFLKHNPEYPTYKDISMMKGRQPESLVECNGFCGTKDLETK